MNVFVKIVTLNKISQYKWVEWTDQDGEVMLWSPILLFSSLKTTQHNQAANTTKLMKGFLFMKTYKNNSQK